MSGGSEGKRRSTAISSPITLSPLSNSTQSSRKSSTRLSEGDPVRRRMDSSKSDDPYMMHEKCVASYLSPEELKVSRRVANLVQPKTPNMLTTENTEKVMFLIDKAPIKELKKLYNLKELKPKFKTRSAVVALSIAELLTETFFIPAEIAKSITEIIIDTSQKLSIIKKKLGELINNLHLAATLMHVAEMEYPRLKQERRTIGLLKTLGKLNSDRTNTSSKKSKAENKYTFKFEQESPISRSMSSLSEENSENSVTFSDSSGANHRDTLVIVKKLTLEDYINENKESKSTLSSIGSSELKVNAKTKIEDTKYMADLFTTLPVEEAITDNVLNKSSTTEAVNIIEPAETYKLNTVESTTLENFSMEQDEFIPEPEDSSTFDVSEYFLKSDSKETESYSRSELQSKTESSSKSESRSKRESQSKSESRSKGESQRKSESRSKGDSRSKTSKSKTSKTESIIQTKHSLSISIKQSESNSKIKKIEAKSSSKLNIPNEIFPELNPLDIDRARSGSKVLSSKGEIYAGENNIIVNEISPKASLEEVENIAEDSVKQTLGSSRSSIGSMIDKLTTKNVSTVDSSSASKKKDREVLLNGLLEGEVAYLMCSNLAADDSEGKKVVDVPYSALDDDVNNLKWLMFETFNRGLGAELLDDKSSPVRKRKIVKKQRPLKTFDSENFKRLLKTTPKSKKIRKKEKEDEDNLAEDEIDSKRKKKKKKKRRKIAKTERCSSSKASFSDAGSSIGSISCDIRGSKSDSYSTSTSSDDSGSRSDMIISTSKTPSGSIPTEDVTADFIEIPTESDNDETLKPAYGAFKVSHEVINVLNQTVRSRKVISAFCRSCSFQLDDHLLQQLSAVWDNMDLNNEDVLVESLKILKRNYLIEHLTVILENVIDPKFGYVHKLLSRSVTTMLEEEEKKQYEKDSTYEQIILRSDDAKYTVSNLEYSLGSNRMQYTTSGMTEQLLSPASKKQTAAKTANLVATDQAPTTLVPKEETLNTETLLDSETSYWLADGSTQVKGEKKQKRSTIESSVMDRVMKSLNKTLKEKGRMDEDMQTRVKNVLGCNALWTDWDQKPRKKSKFNKPLSDMQSKAFYYQYMEKRKQTTLNPLAEKPYADYLRQGPSAEFTEAQLHQLQKQTPWREFQKFKLPEIKCQEYLQKKEIEQIFEKMMIALMLEQPKSPIDFLIDYIKTPISVAEESLKTNLDMSDTFGKILSENSLQKTMKTESNLQLPPIISKQKLRTSQ